MGRQIFSEVYMCEICARRLNWRCTSPRSLRSTKVQYCAECHGFSLHRQYSRYLRLVRPLTVLDGGLSEQQ